MLNAPIDLHVVLSYSLSLVPHCLGTPDGFFSKTNKICTLRFLMESYNRDVQYCDLLLIINNIELASYADVDTTYAIGNNMEELIVKRQNASKTLFQLYSNNSRHK